MKLIIREMERAGRGAKEVEINQRNGERGLNQLWKWVGGKEVEIINKGNGERR